MPEPSMGQPFLVSPGLRVSVGDLRAANGTDAQRGVIVNLGDINPSPYIIAPNTPFTLEVQLRTVLAAAPYPLPNDLATEFHIEDLLTGTSAMAPIVVVESTTPAPTMPAPDGDSGQDDPNDWIVWYQIQTPTINGLAAGVYRVTVIGRSAGMFFIHDDTELMVQP